jgi:hypothetical protein
MTTTAITAVITSTTINPVETHRRYP